MYWAKQKPAAASKNMLPYEQALAMSALCCRNETLSARAEWYQAPIAPRGKSLDDASAAYHHV